MIENFIGKIIEGDTLEVLKTIPSESIDMVFTSPPYYALRNYGVDGQLGLEKTFDEYKSKILEITAELKRVLKPTGTLWWNMGDIYGGSNCGYGQTKESSGFQNVVKQTYYATSKNKPLLSKVNQKCLMMMPERIALEMIDKQGWILRNKIKWVKQIFLKKENITKGSVMPTSVRDRFNESGEELYFFVKSKKYYSDLDAVRLKIQTELEIERPRISQVNFNYRVQDAKRKAGQPQFKASEKEIKNYKMAQVEGQTIQGITRKRLEDRMADTKNKDTKSSRAYNLKKLLSEVRLGIKPNTGMEANKVNGFVPYEEAIGKSWHNHKQDKEKGAGQKEVRACYPLGKNLPSVWLVGSEPHNFQKEVGSDCDHFATFPQALLDIPIRFGCPPDGIVLDPFGGAGTTAIVAKKLGRKYILIELNPKYIELAEKRIRLECPPTLF